MNLNSFYQKILFNTIILKFEEESETIINLLNEIIASIVSQ